MTDVKMTLPDALDRIRFFSERALFDNLAQDATVASLAKRLCENNEEAAGRRRLLATALRITDRIIPSLIERINIVKQVTHLDERDVEVFIHNSPHLTASCMCFQDGDVCLLISSGLYTKLTDQELLFVIGHEFGHVAYQHHLLPSRAIMAQKGECDAGRALRLMAWSRRAEISADRVGLLCCQDLKAAATAFIKLSSGLGDELVDFDLQGYVCQVTDLEEVSRTVRAVEDFYCTHPFNPIRVVALNRFWESQTLCDLLSHTPAVHSDESVDARIGELLSFMDPDADTMNKKSVSDCLLWGGFWLAACDGQIDPAEVQALSRAVGARAARDAVMAIQKSREPLKLICSNFERAAVSCRHLPPPERHAIVQQLIVIAKANVTVSDEEQATLRRICTELDVNPAFPEKILWQYEVDSVFTRM